MTTCQPPSRSTTRPRSSTKSASTSKHWRALPKPGAVAGHAGDRAAAQALAAPQFRSVRPVLLPDRGGRDGHLADRGRPASGATAAILEHLSGANEEANPELLRIALKLATGAGKTTVMAMLIAWQTVNAVRHPSSKQFSRGFLIVTPGITIRDRLRVLSRTIRTATTGTANWCRPTCSATSSRAKIVITNYHAFKLRETDGALQGRPRAAARAAAPELNTLETEGQMLQRVMPDLMGLKNIVVLNDEAHHCYREKPKARRRGRAEGRGEGGSRRRTTRRPGCGSPASRR